MGFKTEPLQVGWLHPGLQTSDRGSTTPVVLLSSYTIDHIRISHRARYYEFFKLTPRSHPCLALASEIDRRKADVCIYPGRRAQEAVPSG